MIIRIQRRSRRVPSVPGHAVAWCLPDQMRRQPPGVGVRRGCVSVDVEKRTEVHILGINALYHDPSAALVVDGRTVAASEEERFSRRKHGKRPVPFSAWELPELG